MSEQEEQDNLVVQTKVHPLKSMLTVSDNQTTCISRVLGAIGAIATLVFQGFIVIHTGSFDIIQFSTGWSLLMASIAGSIKLKDSAEPQGN